MSDRIIPRQTVHVLAEACADMGPRFQPIAARLVRRQRRLTRFFEQNGPALGAGIFEVALYMYSVVLRVFDQLGGEMRKVNSAGIERAAARVDGEVARLRPFDAGFPGRVRQVPWRAQPHLLDEALWALYEREDREEDEVEVPPDKAALVFLALWVAVEALDAVWKPPRGGIPLLEAPEGEAASG